MGTVFLGSFAAGAITFEADYNDNNRNITRVRCIHTGSGNARITLYDPDETTRTIVHQVTLNPGTTTFNVSGQRVTVNPDGSVDVPYGVQLDYPVP